VNQEFTYEDLVRLYFRVLRGRLRDGDICIPKVAADHLEKHGVAPGDFFCEGIRTLDDSSPTKFSFGMQHRIHPIVRKGDGFWARMWRAIQTLPDTWMKKEMAVAWFLRQMALHDFPLPGLIDDGMDPAKWRALDERARERHRQLDEHYKSLFAYMDGGEHLIEAPAKTQHRRRLGVEET
jgi:hypothetical protein